MIRRMWKKLKVFFNKENFEYSQGLVDPFKFHKICFQVLVAFGVVHIENKQNKWLNHNAVIYITATIGFITQLLPTCHAISILDITLITEAGSYMAILIYQLMIVYTTKGNLLQYRNLLKAMKEDFYYVCTEGNKYRCKYFEQHVRTWKICILAIFFPVFNGIGIVSFATLSLIFYMATHKEGDEGTRPLLFPLWLKDVDFKQTPYYEIGFTFWNICALLYGYTHGFMIQTQVLWIRHIASKVDIIIWNMEDLLDGVHPPTTTEELKYFSSLITMRMRRIIIHHQAMLRLLDDYALVYKKLLLYEQILGGPVICLTAFCTAEKFDEGEIQMILIILFISAIVLLFLTSYFCTYLAEKTQSICTACWNIPFWNATPVIRPYLVLLMQRSLRPLPIAAPGFKPISLETYSQKLMSAYSCFNMLRQI